MILNLIGPNDAFIVNYWMEDEAPSVVYTQHRVWVRAANSRPGDNKYYYYEQARGRYLPESFLTKDENPKFLLGTDEDR